MAGKRGAARMSRHLIYVIGPSGAGKDSLLNWLRAQAPMKTHVHWARRTIDRANTPQGEAHESVSRAQFQALQHADAFAMHWGANEHHYGIRHGELQPLKKQEWVFANGSRAYLPEAVALFPGLTVLHISADLEVLKHRLLSRGRETLAAIEQRLQRTPPLQVPKGCETIEFLNHAPLETSGPQLLQALAQLPGWPPMPAH